ncbi:7tm odorant receptor domain-containing protein [Phthorimaea operculella]|nr:7tm odorant receptor domain-containing protein [Phthorimaea operculella]
MATLFLLLTNSDFVYKHAVFWRRFKEIKKLITIMKGPIFNQGGTEHEAVLSQLVRYSRIFLRVFNWTAIATCALWVLYPLILFVQNEPVEIAIWLPFDITSSQNFYAAIVYLYVQTTWLAINNTTVDAFISFFLAQSQTQLSILRADLQSLVQKSKMEAENSKGPYIDILQKRFRDRLLHYNEIVNFTEIVQGIFSGPLLYQFMVSGWIICITAYRALKMEPMSVEFASMILYLCCIVCELFLFCHFGHEVNWESECVLDSAYHMNWLSFPVKLRKDLIIFMERLKRPLKPQAGAFIPLSNNTFVSIMRSSYSFYVLLKNTN